MAAATLLHREHTCPTGGRTPLLDELDENSHKHAYEMSGDLKYALRKSIELLGSEEDKEGTYIRDSLDRLFQMIWEGYPRLHGRVQIVDVFSLEVATGYSRDPHGRLLLHSAPSVAEGRSWSLAKATQLIRNDARPHRWVALQQDKRAWGLFWAGGCLQRCRELLAEQINDAEACSALVPISAERVLELVLSNDHSSSSRSPLPAGLPQQPILQWVALTSAVWLVILALISGGFLLQLERQTRTLEVLLERLEATDIRP